MLKIIVACISLALVACTHDQIKTYIDDYSRLFGVESGRRWLRSAARGVGNEITEAFFLPARSGDNQGGRGGGGGSSYFQNLGAGTGSLSNEIGDGAADSNYFQGWGTDAGGVSHQGGSGGGSINNIQGWGAGGFSNQGSSGAAGDSNFQGWTPIVNGGGRGAGAFSRTGPIGCAGGFNLPIGSAGEGSYGPRPSVSGGAGRVSNQGGNGGAGAGNLQGWTAGAGSVSNQGGTRGGSSSNFQVFTDVSVSASNQGGSGGVGGGSFQGYSANAGSVSNQGGNGDAFGSAGTGDVSNQIGSGRGDRGLPGPIRNAAGFQGYSRGPISRNNRGGSRGAGGGGGFSNQGGSGLGDYQNVPIGSQTSEGRNIDSQLLEQIRFILLQEEASSGLGGEESLSSSSFSAPSSSYGAPSTSFGAVSSAYGAPSVGSGSGRYGHGESGHVVGIVLERIDQSIQIAEIHQTTSELIPSGDDSPWMTSPISSRSYGSRR